jgi:hypothetical protein
MVLYVWKECSSARGPLCARSRSGGDKLIEDFAEVVRDFGQGNIARGGYGTFPH